jgi:hypothetical protein
LKSILQVNLGCGQRATFWRNDKEEEWDREAVCKRRRSRDTARTKTTRNEEGMMEETKGELTKEEEEEGIEGVPLEWFWSSSRRRNQ